MTDDLMPMGPLTYSIACYHCKHRAGGDKERCKRCKCEIKSGFEIDRSTFSTNEGDLISRSALIAAFNKTVLPKEFRIVKTPEARMVVAAHGKLVRTLIGEAPTVDAVEVVHGRWDFHKPDKHGNKKPKCSVCGKYHLYSWADYKKCNYCPHCGAKMDGGEDNDV